VTGEHEEVFALSGDLNLVLWLIHIFRSLSPSASRSLGLLCGRRWSRGARGRSDPL